MESLKLEELEGQSSWPLCHLSRPIRVCSIRKRNKTVPEVAATPSLGLHPCLLIGLDSPHLNANSTLLFVSSKIQAAKDWIRTQSNYKHPHVHIDTRSAWLHP